MSKVKKFDIDLSLSEYYAIRHALEIKGNEENLLLRINKKISQLHKFFDGNYHRHQILEGIDNEV